jgi:cytochrome c biogenesis protein CcmG/thiol:disulfide interchange protein DsbE
VCPAEKEHKFLMELSKNENVKIIGLNFKDNLNNAKKFINELGNPYSKNLTDKNGLLSIEFGAYGVPETFIINKRKIIVNKFIGPINKKTLNQIRKIIK